MHRSAWLGRWQEVEYRTAYQRFIEIEKLDEKSVSARTEVRVIPVLLPGASENPVPLFAQQLYLVDMRASGDAKHRVAMQELVRAILDTSGIGDFGRPTRSALYNSSVA